MSDLIEMSELTETEETVTQVDHAYGGSEIQVLEGLEASRHVYRFHQRVRAASSGL